MNNRIAEIGYIYSNIAAGVGALFIAFAAYVGIDTELATDLLMNESFVAFVGSLLVSAAFAYAITMTNVHDIKD